MGSIDCGAFVVVVVVTALIVGVHSVFYNGLTYFIEILEGDFSFSLFVIVLENLEYVCFLHLKTKSSNGNLER